MGPTTTSPRAGILPDTPIPSKGDRRFDRVAVQDQFVSVIPFDSSLLSCPYSDKAQGSLFARGPNLPYQRCKFS